MKALKYMRAECPRFEPPPRRVPVHVVLSEETCGHALGGARFCALSFDHEGEHFSWEPEDEESPL